MKVASAPSSDLLVYAPPAADMSSYKKKCCKKFKKSENKRCKKCPGRASCGVLKAYAQLSAHLAD